jgi:hypothetical protein
VVVCNFNLDMFTVPKFEKVLLSAEQCPEVRAVHSGAQGSVCQQDLLLRSGPEYHQGKEHLHGLEH